MGNRLYVGNLAWSTREDAIRSLFEQADRTVTEVALVTDRSGERSRGFAFVTMGSEEEATAAMLEHNEVELDGRPLKVKEATEKRRGDGGFIPSSSGGRGREGGFGGRRGRDGGDW